MQFDIPQERLDALLAEGWTITDDGYLEPPAPTRRRPWGRYRGRLARPEPVVLTPGTRPGPGPAGKGAGAEVESRPELPAGWKIAL